MSSGCGAQDMWKVPMRCVVRTWRDGSVGWEFFLKPWSLRTYLSWNPQNPWWTEQKWVCLYESNPRFVQGAETESLQGLSSHQPSSRSRERLSPRNKVECDRAGSYSGLCEVLHLCRKACNYSTQGDRYLGSHPQASQTTLISLLQVQEETLSQCKTR